ncbi:MAG: hypothetical protein GX824_09520 [Clostridiales bacterium]|nr:hypothetical protein [Clostridiales bacterium]
MQEVKKTDNYPYREPKKYPKKSLHGRVRFGQLCYNDFKRFQRFYVNVFGWDMFELPEAAGGEKKGSENPALLIATGPSYETWEGLNPGHMNMGARYTEGEVGAPTIMMVCHMDRPLKVTAQEIIDNGGSIVGEIPDERDGWSSSLIAKDPSGNILPMWKCPSSRTWEEPEAGYDKD